MLFVTELAALPFNHSGSDVKTMKPTSSSFGLFFTSEGSSVLIMYVSTCHVASAVLWALDYSSESPRVLWGRCLHSGKLTWSGKDSLSCNGLEKSWHLKESQLTFGLTRFCLFAVLSSYLHLQKIYIYSAVFTGVVSVYSSLVLKPFPS